MASHAIALYAESRCSFALDGEWSVANVRPEPSFVREGAIVDQVPLAILPPPSSFKSGSSSLRSTARSKGPVGAAKKKAQDGVSTTVASIKRSALAGEGPSKRTFVSPLGSLVVP